MSLRIFYISNYPLSGDLSPSINELDFVEALERNLGPNVFYFLRNGEVDVLIEKKRVSFFCDSKLSQPIKFFFHAIKWAWQCKILINKFDADLIVIRPNRAPLKEIILKLITKKKIVLKSSAKYWMDGEGFGFLDSILSKLDLFFYKVLHKLVDGIESVTEEYKDFHLRNGISEKKLAVVGNGISMSRFHVQSRPHKKDFYPVLGYCGAQPSERGAEEILFLVEKLLPKYPNVKGLIVGYDDGMHDLALRAEQKGLKKNFELVGKVPFAKVPEYLHVFDVGFSFTHVRDIVGGDSSMKLRQYLACGIPVITFPQSNKFVENEGLGYLVDLGDQDKLLSVTQLLLRKIEEGGDEYKNKLSKYAYQNFSHDFLLRKRLEFWNSILKEQS